MADLSPDLSLYQQNRPMGLDQLMGLVQQSRGLQSQQAVSDALRQSGGDPEKANQMLMQPGAPGFVDAHTITSLTQAAQARAQLGQWYMGQASTAIGSLLSKPGATLDDWHKLRPLLEQYHVPTNALDAVEAAAGKNGRLDHDSLTAVYNLATQNSGLPQGQTVKGAGYEATPPAGTQLYRSGGATAPTSPSAPGASSVPSGGTAAPPSQDAASKAADEVQRQYSGYGAGGGTVVNPSAAVQDRWTNSAREYSGAAAASGQYPSDVTPMEKVIDLLKKDPNLSGRGMEEFNNVKNFAHSVGILKDADMDKVVDFETMKKYMANVPNTSSAGGTDSRLWQSIAGSPSPDKLGQTNLNVMRVMLGLRRMQQAGFNEFRRISQQRPMPPEYYSDWYSSWARKQDPMAYVWNTMGKKEQEKYGNEHFTGQSSSVWRKFEDDKNAAEQALAR